MNSSKIVVITGAGGFIGLNIVRLFAQQGWHIIAVVNHHLPLELTKIKNCTILKKDLTKETLIFDKKPDVLIHAAGLASDIGFDKTFRKLNFEMVQKVALLAKKFIYISSSDVYGIKDFHGETEEMLCYEKKPINPYPKYKILSEQWIKTHLKKDTYIILRPGAVWGAGDKTLENRFASFLKKSPFLFFFGKWRGKNRWPLADVNHVAQIAFTCAISDEFNGLAVTIIDKEITSISDFYEKMRIKYTPHKYFYRIYLPFWVGSVLGKISTFLSTLLCCKKPLFDPSYYAVHHISSNLDWSCALQEKILAKYQEFEKQKKRR